MEKTSNNSIVRIICQKLVIERAEFALQWLVGSPFFSPPTIISTFKCIHTLLDGSPDYQKESDDLRVLLLKGFSIVGALVVRDSDFESNATKAVDNARRLLKLLSHGDNLDGQETIGAVADVNTSDIHFFVSRSGDHHGIYPVNSAVYEQHPETFVWERGCLLRCELPIRLPFYYPVTNQSVVERRFLNATEAVVAKFRDPKVVYMIESLNKVHVEPPQTVLLRGRELNFDEDLSSTKVAREVGEDYGAKILTCAHFCLKSESSSAGLSAENADILQVSVLLSTSAGTPQSSAPVADYIPALEEVRVLVVDYKLEVLCYAVKDLPLSHAVSNLIIPALVDQFNLTTKILLPNLLMQHPRLHPYHFNPPGLLHPITVIYELSYGETELKQVDARRSLHARLGLPLDRPLLRIANAFDLSMPRVDSKGNSVRKDSYLLKDVHSGIHISGVSGGSISLVQGSYEYYHYLQNGFDDSGWGCAYRSLQTIISWFRLQQYTSTEVPSHREIQQSLVEIGDKDPSFTGSREWIGAIELSFVLDKLLGVSCKVINVRSGAELPEKCRELALHFENQGTPIMIGGGVLAYTLLGIDYNEASGDCAFLILDPHYTGNEDLKKIVNGGWCGWKKAVDSKGKNFFLHNKFYNLLLPQRPNMV